jgi:hypothetical protein
MFTVPSLNCEGQRGSHGPLPQASGTRVKSRCAARLHRECLTLAGRIVGATAEHSTTPWPLWRAGEVDLGNRPPALMTLRIIFGEAAPHDLKEHLQGNSRRTELRKINLCVRTLAGNSTSWAVR